ncbi:cysteine hydrolase family protein [Zunongwangia sp.]|uniref:cysteine hydrolase family protein n=1 Tax=Zunongwangia sp. TaxID=1965325 RepID=UPI003AA8C33C
MSKALLIIDIQNDYFKNGAMELKNPIPASLHAKKIVEKFREASMPIVHIQHLSKSAEASFFLPNTKGQEIHKNVKPLPDEKIIVKNYPNSFLETELLEYLQSLNITELVITGMMTHVCIDATTRAAKDFGFKCTVINDACATRDVSFNESLVKAEDVHHAFLGALKMFYANVISTNEFLSK